MAVAGKCLREGCPFKFDDAEHLQDAVDKCAAHFRLEHPTKAFYENRYKEQLEVLNFTLTEAVANYAGRRWEERLAAGEIESRHITHACRQVCRYPDNYQREVIEGAQALSAEHGHVIDDPWNAANQRAIEEPFIDVGYIDN